MNIYKIIEKLYEDSYINPSELLALLNNIDNDGQAYLTQKAHQARLKYYQNRVFFRGLIEFSNYCKNDCLYCGIRKSNKKADRYRLETNRIIELCKEGYQLGYKTFVLQSGEDNSFKDDDIVDLVKQIKSKLPDCAITLSIGEKSYDSYVKYFNAGVDRYLLRHETASEKLYNELHPKMSYENRIQCLYNLKEIGYQVGAGFMVGLPNQTNEDYVNDFMFLKKLHPHMIGIGPFIPHCDTPLADNQRGTLNKTLLMISIARLFLPDSLIPATTALGSIDPNGREIGITAGANVVMPNLTPVDEKKKYVLYDGKICIDEDSTKCRHCLEKRIINIGFLPDMSRGDHISISSNRPG